MFNLEERMKEDYEKRNRHFLTRRVPVIVRVDGRAFHTFTKGFPRPFSMELSTAMVGAAIALAEEMQGFKVGYVQSDEASFLLTDYDEINTGAWFNYCQGKIDSISSSIMTAAFNRLIGTAKPAHFDARSFNVPKEEIANYFLWRAKDWERNSLTMYCQSFFSAKQLMGKNKEDKHQMLHEIGKNWAMDVPERFRNGCWIFKDGVRTDILPNYPSVQEVMQ